MSKKGGGVGRVRGRVDGGGPTRMCREQSYSRGDFGKRLGTRPNRGVGARKRVSYIRRVVLG